MHRFNNDLNKLGAALGNYYIRWLARLWLVYSLLLLCLVFWPQWPIEAEHNLNPRAGRSLDQMGGALLMVFYFPLVFLAVLMPNMSFAAVIYCRFWSMVTNFSNSHASTPQAVYHYCSQPSLESISAGLSFLLVTGCIGAAASVMFLISGSFFNHKAKIKET